jgi:competence protein ComEC
MFDLRRIPVVKVLIPFAAGALSGSLAKYPVPIWGVVLSALLGWFCLLILFLKLRRKPISRPWFFCLWVFLICFADGVGNGLLTRPVDPKLPVGERVIIRGVVKQAPTAGQSKLRCELGLQMLYAPDTVYRSQTLLQVYLSPDGDSVVPQAGETWQWLGFLTPIRNSGNPGSPDFESIMHRKDCWYRFYASGPNDPVHSVRVGSSVRKADSDFIRHALSGRWQGDEEELALLKAVCLGDRASLTEDMHQNYGAAGGMHLLAVSGLHVGLIWWVLNKATRWMVRKTRSEVYRTLAVLGLLWFYASVTGFSASVCRSVTMFSLFSAGRMLGQGTHGLNGIFVSALILLVIQPTRLMEPGFQLSYAAILGIVAIYPFFRSLFSLKYRLLKWLWEAAAVSLAAQLFTAPLIIYYFHQLPVYSLLTSILAIPMLSLLIALFTCSVPFMMFGILENIFNFTLTSLARLMNLTMEAVAAIPGALLEDMHLSLGMLVLWMILLSLSMLALQGRSRLPASLVLFVFSVVMLWSAWNLASRRRTSELVLGHFRGASMVTLREGDRVDHYCWYRDSSSLAYMQNYRSDAWSRRIYLNHLHMMGDSAYMQGSVSACIELTRGIWSVGNDQFCFWVVTKPVKNIHLALRPLDTAGTGMNRPDFILLSGEPEVFNLEVLASGSAIDLVVDGSSRTWYRESIHSRQTRIHDTEVQGAYVKEW